MDDLISRQAVLDTIDAEAWAFCDYLIRSERNDEQTPVSQFADNLRDVIRNELPSVTAEQTHEEWCIDCKEYDQEQHCCHRYCKVIRQAVDEIKQAERTGHWQQDMDGTFLCSECGSGFKEQPTLMGKPMFLWCPLCGARMVGVDNE